MTTFDFMTFHSQTCGTCGAQESSPPSLCSDWARRSADRCSLEAEVGPVRSHQFLPADQKRIIYIYSADV